MVKRNPGESLVQWMRRLEVLELRVRLEPAPRVVGFRVDGALKVVFTRTEIGELGDELSLSGWGLEGKR